MTNLATITERARYLLESNRAFVTMPCTSSQTQRCDSTGTNITLHYPTLCSMGEAESNSNSNLSNVLETTSTLLAARSYAKMGDSQAAWEALDAIFMGTSHGLFPKYRYFGTDPNEHFKNSHDCYYIPNTTIPNWPLFDPYGNNDDPANTATSRRLSSIPIHASIVLETFYLTNQTQSDLDGLERSFWHLWTHYEYIHTVVLQNCPGENCYNVIHPWETLSEGTLDTQALQKIKHQMQSTQWKINFDIPLQVQHSWNFEKSIYPIMVYLLECQSNATRDCNDAAIATNTDDNYENQENNYDCEGYMIQSCPFSMLDVGHAAALLQSNRDLQIMANILVDATNAPSRLQLLQLAEWEQKSQEVFDSLWNEDKKAFLSKTSQGTLQPDATNFLGMWATRVEDNRLDDMALHLMQHEGDMAFDCGAFPLWSVGGCKKNATISPLLNYMVARGLKRNGMNGLAHYFNNSTLNLLCQSTNDYYDDDGRCDSVFVDAFDALHHRPVQSMDACSSSWTSTAAIAYNLVIPDKTFSYIPSPPIRASWVIVLVFGELIVAFAMGLSCLLLSLSLMKRLNDVVENEDDNNDELLNMGLLDTVSLNFFSAADSETSSIGAATSCGVREGHALDTTVLVGYSGEDYADKD